MTALQSAPVVPLAPHGAEAPEIADGLSREQYDEILQRLSEGSVHQHFDAFADIDWDSPEFAIDRTDARWVLPEVDPLGAHPWYKSLPLERQIEIGIWRQANICRVGMQFENILIRGVMEYVYKLDNDDPEFRYLTHEVTEETHHTQMFQEFVNRTGMDVPGSPVWFRKISFLLPLAGNLVPELFFTGVLAGEEPIDHVQKAIIRSSDLHPLLQRIMQIHIAEEARHISFAHNYLKRNVPQLSPVRKAALSITYPLVMRLLADVIIIPPKEITTEMGVPREVIKELYWDSPEGTKLLSDLFGDVRTLAQEIGLMNPVAKRLWKVLGIAGRPARFRSEPARLAA